MKADPETFDRIRGALARPSVTLSSSDYDLNRGTNPRFRPDQLRDAGVLCALEERNGELHVILTRRSSALKHHPGQVAFPGGKKDAGDPSATHAALREAWEEIGLPVDAVEVLGHLPTHETISRFTVLPVVARVTRPFEERAEPGEVDEIFRVPLAHLLNPDNYWIHGRQWRGQTRHYYAVPWGPYYIWGATARMLRMLAAVLA